MRKTIYLILFGIAFVFLIRIIRILIFDVHRLTDYGIGYLVGQIILFLLFVVMAIMVSKYKKN